MRSKIRVSFGGRRNRFRSRHVAASGDYRSRMRGFNRDPFRGNGVRFVEVPRE
jgi:hypothetical protein